MPENNGGSAMGMLFSCIFFIVWLGLIALVVAGWWKLFVKAGEPGWAAIVPIYNLIVLIKIAGKPIWWIVMAIIPCLNIIFLILVALEIAKAFGKDVGYAIGLFLLPMVFYPLLGFSNAQYQGTKSSF